MTPSNTTVLCKWQQEAKFYMGPLQTELHYTVTLLHITAQCVHVCLPLCTNVHSVPGT